MYLDLNFVGKKMKSITLSSRNAPVSQINIVLVVQQIMQSQCKNIGKRVNMLQFNIASMHKFYISFWVKQNSCLYDQLCLTRKKCSTGILSCQQNGNQVNVILDIEGSTSQVSKFCLEHKSFLLTLRLFFPENDTFFDL